MAIDREELIVGVVCVAAPVFRDNIAVAAVSVTGPKAWIGPLRAGRANRRTRNFPSATTRLRPSVANSSKDRISVRVAVVQVVPIRG
jgi:DNA-binding IclR family transcriptional regulator